MIGRTNTGTGGGGLSPNNAVIHVTAPSGSTISFFKNGTAIKVLSASNGHVNADDNTLSDWYYSVSPSNYGVLTVTAAKGSATSSGTVTVSDNDIYELSLAFSLYLFNNGDSCTDVTGGWTTSGYGRFVSDMDNIAASISGSNMVFNGSDSGHVGLGTVNAIDFAPYNTFVVVGNVSQIKWDTGFQWCGCTTVKSDPDAGRVLSWHQNTVGNFTKQIDISGVTDAVYVFAAIVNSVNGRGTISQIYLTS